MLQYLEKKYGERATVGDKQNLINLRNEVKRLEAQLAEKKQKTADSSNDHKSDKGSENETDEDVSSGIQVTRVIIGRRRVRRDSACEAGSFQEERATPVCLSRSLRQVQQEGRFQGSRHSKESRGHQRNLREDQQLLYVLRPRR